MSRKKPREEVLVGEGITIARSGRFISIRSHRTPEQQAALRTALAARRAAVPEEIRQRVVRLDAIMARYNPLDLIASAALKHLFVDPESFAEHNHEGSQVEVEYLALLCLRNPFRGGELREDEGSDFDTVFTLVHEIFQLTRDAITFDLPDEGVDAATLAAHELRQRTRMNELVVRSPGYPHHLAEALRGLFGNRVAAEWMQRELGFTIEDAIRLDAAVAEIVQTRLNDRLEKAKEDEKALRRALTRFRRSGEVTESIPREVLVHLAGLKEREARRTIRGLLLRWALFAWGDTYSFTADELAAEAGVTPAVAEAFLNGFSIEFGGIPIDEYIPSPTHPLRVRPFIRHPRGYICPSPASVLWAIRPRLESMMKPVGRESRGTSERTWERYQKARADFLVNRTLDLLAQILKRAQVCRNLSYEGGELDGLVLFDTYAFLMEAKAGDFGPPARRGAPRGMLEDLRALVAEPHRQAIRARDFIDQNDVPAFTAADGTRVEFDKAKYRNRILMTVTLEPLDVFVTTFQQLKELGLFTDTEMPWAIQLLDLRIISDLIEFPSQLMHYLSRRLRLNELGKLDAHDELDWFGHYLSEGLFFEGAVDDLDRLSLTSYTGDIDAYYFFITGQRKTPARKPQQPMPDLYRQVLAELEERDGEGYVSVSLAFLDLGGRDRKFFAKHLKRIRDQSARDGRLHDFTMGYQSHGWGLTVMSGPAGSVREVHDKLSAFCSLKKYELRCERWTGVGTVSDLPGIVHAWSSVAFPWNADDKMEEVVRRVRESKRRTRR